MYLAEHDKLIRFWGHEVKGQRSQGSLCMQKQLVIALSEEPIDGFLPNFGHVCILQSPMNWLDFVGHEVKGHRAHYICQNSSWSRYLKNRLMDSCQTLVMYVSCRANELIRFWGSRGQRSQGLIMYAKTARDRVIWRTDWWIPAKLWSCMYLAEPMNWLDFGGHEVKGQRSQGLLCMQKQLVIALSENLLMDYKWTWIWKISSVLVL